MFSRDTTLSNKLRRLTAVMTLISMAWVIGSVSATADNLLPQASTNIGLGDTPNPAAATLIGASANDHLSGNGTANTSSVFPRAHAIATGDFNRDGFQDIAIGAPDADFAPGAPATPRANAGAVYILFGRQTFPAGTLIDTNTAALSQPDVKIFGGAADDNVGFSLAVGDLNADGAVDLAIGAPGVDAVRGTPAALVNNTGAVYVLFGSTTFTARTIDLSTPNPANVLVVGERENDRFGSAIAIGDVNGTAAVTPDLLVGAPGSLGPNPVAAARANGGAAYVVTGGANFENTTATIKTIDLGSTVVGAITAAVKIYGRTGSQLGSSVAIGDINAGGAQDIIVGAPKASRPENAGDLAEAGAVYVVLGGTGLAPPTGSTTKTFDINTTDQAISIYGASANDHLGASVAAGATRGGNTADLVIGAPDADGAGDNKVDSGEVYIIGGGAGLTPAPPPPPPAPQTPNERRINIDTDSLVSLRVLGALAGNHLGSYVTIGQVNTAGNTDTIPDVLMGGPGFLSNSGGVFVLYGGANLLIFSTRDLALGQDDLRVVGQAQGDELGWAIATGDIDNNRGGDLIVGAPFADVTLAPDNTRVDAGKVYLLLAAADVIPPVNRNPTVSVVLPNGGETIAAGTRFNITWTASDPDGDNTIQSFQIRLSTDGGATFPDTNVIAANLAGNARTFPWDVPLTLNTTAARIRVIATDNAGGQSQDDSNANFTITTNGAIVDLTVPNGGETLRFGQSFTIRWTVSEEFRTQVAGFDIFLSTNGGTTFNQIIAFNGPGTPALGPDVREFNWLVQPFCTNQARVQVAARLLSGGTALSASEGNFTISEPGPTIDVGRASLSNNGTRLNLRTTTINGTEVRFIGGAKVEISTNETGTTFFELLNVKKKNSGKKLLTKGTINNQDLGQFWPDGAVRILRVTNPTCGVTILRLRRQGDLFVAVATIGGQSVEN
jgi:hypothetical protein